MAKPKIERWGDDVYGVVIRGDRNDPEKSTFRVAFPGGDLELARTTDDQYWVHVRVNHPDSTSYYPEDVNGSITDARLDLVGRHTSDVDIGEFDDPALYHLAIKVGPSA